VPDNSVYVASERRKYRIRRLHTYREGHAAYVMKHGNRDIAVACGRQGEGDPPARRVIHAIQRGRDGAMLVSPAMGMYGTWFVATETELARCWRLRRRGQRVKFVNPWTKEPILDPKTKKRRMVMQDDEIEIFSDVIKTLPHVQVKWLDDKCVGRFFGPAVKVEKIGWDRAGFLFRVPDRAVAQLVERKPRLSLLVEDWEANVHDLDGPYVQDIVDEGTAKTLLKLAKRAAKVGSSFCGWYF
jgi:hypothetical protein